LAARLGDRWTVLADNLRDASLHAMSAAPSRRLYTVIRELAALGLDPARAGDHYRLGRPPVADLGMSQNG
jgi:hypothetical protein